MKAKACGDRENLTADQWRARARYLREFALTVIDDRTSSRMEQRAKEYELMASLIDADRTAIPLSSISAAPIPAAPIPASPEPVGEALAELALFALRRN